MYAYNPMRAVVVVAILVITQGCAVQRSGSATGLGLPLQRATLDTKSPAHRIMNDELRQVEGFTALDAVRRLRPEFLQPSAPRPSTASTLPAVYENGHFSGGIDQLRDIPLGLVIEIQRLSLVEARVMFGASCPCDGGVIAVKTMP